MLTVACVLRSGGEYHPAHVVALRNGFARNLTIPHRFVCLSDVESPHYERIPLVHDWPGWFSKLELFRPGVFDGPVVFADLDTVVVGNCDDLVLGHRFTVLRNFWVDMTHTRIGSGLMAWDTSKVDLSPIYDAFRADPDRHMADCGSKERWGDQGFIQFNTPVEPERWQDKVHGRVVSYKFHCKAGVPKRASIVCFHGRPRPWHTELWRAA